MKSYSDLVTEAKASIREVTPAETIARAQTTPDLLLVDCREPNETNLGRAAGACCIPRGLLEQGIEAAADRSRPVVLYCASGNRSALAALTLQAMGYTDVASMRGGFRAWVDAGGEMED